jgi:hypothetical protein
MLLANISVATTIAAAFPDRALLRRHPQPNPRKLAAAASAAKDAGEQSPCKVTHLHRTAIPAGSLTGCLMVVPGWCTAWLRYVRDTKQQHGCCSASHTGRRTDDQLSLQVWSLTPHQLARWQRPCVRSRATPATQPQPRSCSCCSPSPCRCALCVPDMLPCQHRTACALPMHTHARCKVPLSLLHSALSAVQSFSC